VKIVAIADTHSAHRKAVLPEGDILIHAGDLSLALRTSFFQQRFHITDCDEWFGEQKFKKIFCVAGNHDFVIEKKQVEFKNCVYLENQHHYYEGVKFFGSPYQLPFFGAFNANEKQLEAIYGKIEDDTDVIISHGAPFGILDQPFRGGNTGSKALKNAIDRVKPKLVVFGHIHWGHGTHTEDGVTYFNAALAGKTWDSLDNSPLVFDFEE